MNDKGKVVDGAFVVGGSVATVIAESLPLIIAFLTVMILLGRLVLTYQEYRLNRKKLKEKE